MTDSPSFHLTPPDQVWKHAISTPLTTIRLALEQTEHQLTKHPTARTYLSHALAQARYLYQLITEPQALQFSLREMLVSTTARLDCDPQRRLTLLDHLRSNITIQSNPVEFQEALSCAIMNAWEAYHDHDQPVVVINAYRKQNQLILQIQDFGEGMNWLTRHSLGHRAHSSKGKDRGLGTRFIRYVVEDQLKGRVIYSSYVGLGTTQTWLIPVPPADTQTL